MAEQLGDNCREKCSGIKNKVQEAAEMTGWISQYCLSSILKLWRLNRLTLELNWNKKKWSKGLIFVPSEGGQLTRAPVCLGNACNYYSACACVLVWPIGTWKTYNYTVKKYVKTNKYKHISLLGAGLMLYNKLLQNICQPLLLHIFFPPFGHFVPTAATDHKDRKWQKRYSQKLSK